jgi:hypothetical protein
MIGESLIPSVSRQRTFRIVQKCLREAALKSPEKIENLRQLELYRLDRLIHALDPKRSDPRVAYVLIRISALIARLHGLDAPQRIETSRPKSTLMKGMDSSDLNKLSDEEQRRLEVLLEKAGAPLKQLTQGRLTRHGDSTHSIPD